MRPWIILLVPLAAAAAQHYSYSGNDPAQWSRTVLRAVPGVFRQADGAAVALNQDGSVNSKANPAKVGSIVSIWATGIGRISLPLVDGQIATSAENYYCCSVFTYYGSTQAEVLYSGAAPGTVAGVVQINFRIPEPPLPLREPTETWFYVAPGFDSLTNTPAIIWVGP